MKNCGYMLLAIGDKAEKFVDYEQNKKITPQFKNHAKVIESIRENKGDILVLWDDELHLGIAVCLDDVYIAGLSELAKQFGYKPKGKTHEKSSLELRQDEKEGKEK